MKHFLLTTLTSITVLGLYAGAVNVKHVKSVPDNFPSMVSTVQVLDSSEEPIPGLKSGNFSLAVDASQVDSIRVTSYGETGLGLNIMLCIDTSGSMRGAPIQMVKEAILPFIDRVRSVDKIGISIYADDYRLLTDFTSDKELLKRVVKDIQPQGSYTALYYGAYKALQHLKNSETQGGKILVLMGDGKNENPSESYNENDVIKVASEEGIPIFSIGYTKVETIYLQALERMADSTGGSYYYAPNAADLKAHFERLNRQISNIYILSYLVTGVAGDGKEHNLMIKASNEMGSQEARARFTAPAGRKAASASKKGGKGKLGLGLILIIVGGLIVIGAGGYFLLRSAKRKRLAEEQRLQDLEDQRRREVEAERQRRVELEKELQRKNMPQPDQGPPTQPKVPPMSADRERTMILGPGGQTSKPGGQATQLRMEIVLGNMAGKIFTIDSSGATIGRVGDNRIVLSDNTVSAHHARISYEGGSFQITDLGSSNGTYINGNKISSFRITDGCSFKIGAMEGTFSLL